MSDVEDTEQCPNCKLDILSPNFTIHFVHCQRNIYLCSKCERPVNHDKRDEHDEANHVTVQCGNCHLALEKYLLDDHSISDCPNRGVKCQICDIDVKANDLEEHEDYCGSRTEKCPECGEFVMLKYKSLHLDSNHTFIKLSDEPGPSPSWQYGRRTLCNFIPDLSEKPFNLGPVPKRKSKEPLRRSRNSGSSESKDNSCEIRRRNLGVLFSDKTNDLPESKADDDIDVKRTPKRDADEWPALAGFRSLQISEGKQDNSRSAVASKVDEDADLLYAIQVSDEINSELFRKENNMKEEAFKNWFKPLNEDELSAEKSVEKNMFERNPKKGEEPRVDPFKNNFKYFYDKQEIVKLPCEFCGNLIVSNDLILHQTRCRIFKSDNYNFRAGPFRMPYVDEDADKKIPCGFCNKLFWITALQNHQLQCQRNSSKSRTQSFSKNLKAVNMKSEPGLQNGLEASSPQVTRMGTRSEWLSEMSKRSEGRQEMRSSLSQPGSGVVTRATKASRKGRRAPSPPTR